MSLKINVGCGSRFHPEWLNLDLHSHSPGVVSCDLTQGIPVQDGQANMVYSAAVLEHIRLQDVPVFLQECRRVLKNNGILRLAVPDLEQQAKVYLESIDRLDHGDKKATFDREWMILEMIDQCVREKTGGKMLEFLLKDEIPNRNFIINRIGVEGRDLMNCLHGLKATRSSKSKPSSYDMVPWGRFGKALLKKLLRSKNLEQDMKALEVGRFRYMSGESHQWAYDRFSLAEVMSTAGFRNPIKKAHGESLLEHWGDYHLEIDQHGVVEKPDLLVMEAIK